MDFYSIILRLHGFWQRHGCRLLPPHDVETGAGTLNPAAFFGVLGSSPCRVGYITPNRRPADGRYGEDPLRLRLHHQYQVVLKPPPPEIQEIYLSSLEDLGLRSVDHDISFSAEDWASPALAVSGVGWQVLLDGIPITRLTYFQRMGGVDLDPVSVGLAYGLERIALVMQGGECGRDFAWDDGRSYHALCREKERQFSVYNFDRGPWGRASTERILKMLELGIEECSDSLVAGRSSLDNSPWGEGSESSNPEALFIPAYDLVLRCAHLLDLLDARDALTAGEKAGFTTRIRELTECCAQEYLRFGGRDA